MTKIEWFDLLVELDPEQRALKLQEIRLLDADLAAQLERLLALDAADADQPDTLELQLGDQLNQAIAQTVQARTQIGSYRLLGLLGQGGMGEVWRAERDVAGNKQPLALKILKLEDMSAEAHERFALEQRTLLKLVHPNIARLLDAGVASDGRPWIAMELVEGVPITQYCDQHQLSINARLALFRQVIAAVQYAHDYFIVHRDIKPDNVLVDETGTVKLLDFGIAKSLDRHAPHTLTQQRFFSLYATAPEQLLGSSVCVGTDVYALGGLLYELLSGAPLISRELKTPAQLQTFIVEKTPTLPSKIADANAAANRSAASIAKLSANLAGDLDRIVLHALRKLPSERYASAREFDEDIQAFLEHRPVKAAGQGKRYRASKFLRRHWLAASISGLALASLLALTVLLGLRGNQLQRANTVALEQQKRAEAAKATADEARVAAESVNSFLIDVFKRADPLARERGDKGLSVVIDASFAEIKARQKFDQTTAPILIALVQGLISLGKTDEAGPLLEQIEKEIELTPSQQLQVVLIGGDIAQIEQDVNLLTKRIAQTEQMDAALFDAQQREHVLDLRARLANVQGQFEEVLGFTEARDLSTPMLNIRVLALSQLKMVSQARELVMNRLARSDVNAIDRLFLQSALGRIANRSGDREEELRQTSAAYQSAMAFYGPENSRLLSFRNSYAAAMMRNGQFEAAEAEFSAIVQQARALFKQDDPRFYFFSFNIGICQAKRGVLTPESRERLVAATVGKVSEISLPAAIALARDDYINHRRKEFDERIRELIAMLKPEDITPELAIWIAVMRGDDQSGPGWRSLIEPVAQYDPKIKQLFN